MHPMLSYLTPPTLHPTSPYTFSRPLLFLLLLHHFFFPSPPSTPSLLLLFLSSYIHPTTTLLLQTPDHHHHHLLLFPLHLAVRTAATAANTAATATAAIVAIADATTTTTPSGDPRRPATSTRHPQQPATPTRSVPDRTGDSSAGRTSYPNPTTHLRKTITPSSLDQISNRFLCNEYADLRFKADGFVLTRNVKQPETLSGPSEASDGIRSALGTPQDQNHDVFMYGYYETLLYLQPIKV